jgi:hypothetical protein
MARKQYRLYSPGDWTSNFGYSFVAITNVSGSGKKLTLRQIEVQVASANNGSATAGAAPCALLRCDAPLLGGEDMSAASVRCDANTALPSGVVVRRRAIASSYTSFVRRVDLAKRATTAASVNDARFQQMSHGQGGRTNGLYRSSLKQTAVEALRLNQNEALALVCQQTAAPYMCPVRVSVLLSVNGRTVSWDFLTVLMPGEAAASIENTGTATVLVLKVAASELGTTDTPTIRLVPIGQVRAGDINDAARQSIVAMPMNTADGALSSSICRIFSDVGFQPYGVPEVYIAPGSTGSPKDMNYLHTRDFDGPMYRNFLPEMCAVRGVGTSAPDMLGLSLAHRWSDLLMRRKSACPATPIIINPGEGVALVSSAETAVGVQASWSGWPLLYFGAVLDVEPYQVPTIAATGMASGSRYRVERVSDGSLVTEGVAGAGGDFSYLYETEDTPLNMRLKVRKASAAPYYKPYEVTFALTSTGISVPVSQVVDP